MIGVFLLVMSDGASADHLAQFECRESTQRKENADHQFFKLKGSYFDAEYVAQTGDIDCRQCDCNGHDDCSEEPPVEVLQHVF